MPHIILEHSCSVENIIIENSFKEGLFNVVLNNSDAKSSSIRCRFLKYENYYYPFARDFIHVTVKMLPGRSKRQLLIVSESIMSYIKDSVLSFDSRININCSSEIIEIDCDTYVKWSN